MKCKFCGRDVFGGWTYEDASGKTVHACWKCDDKATKEMVEVARMESKEMKRKHQCIFHEAWIGPCKKPAVKGSYYCKEHHGKKCARCGKQATHECSTAGSLVCGTPLCSDCICPVCGV